MRIPGFVLCLITIIGMPSIAHATSWNYSVIGLMYYMDLPTGRPPSVISGTMVVDDQMDDQINDWFTVQPPLLSAPAGKRYGFLIKEFLVFNGGPRYLGPTSSQQSGLVIDVDSAGKLITRWLLFGTGDEYGPCCIGDSFEFFKSDGTSWGTGVTFPEYSHLAPIILLKKGWMGDFHLADIWLVRTGIARKDRIRALDNQGWSMKKEN